MKGHITQRAKGTWSVIVELGRDANGKRKQKWITVKGTKKKAQSELNQLLVSLDQGTYVEPTKQTVAEFLRLWISITESKVAPKTFDRYQEIIEKHLIPNLGHYRLTKLSTDAIEAYYAETLANGRLDGKGGLAPRTVHHYHRLLCKALNHAVKKRRLAYNPATLADAPTVQHEEMRALTTDETANLLLTAQGSRLYAPVLTLVTSGLRRGELLGLRWKDIDFDKGTLSVNQSVQQIKREVSLKPPKTKRSRRTLSLPSITLDALRAHQIEQKKLRLQLGKYYQTELDLVFPNIEGGIWLPDVFSSAFRALVAKSGLGHFRAHDTRHTHASQLLRDGVNPKIVSERLGHSTVAFTLDVYGHVMPDMEAETAAIIDASLGAAMRGKRGV